MFSSFVHIFLAVFWWRTDGPAAYPQDTYRARYLQNYQFWPHALRYSKNYSVKLLLMIGLWCWGVTTTNVYIETLSLGKLPFKTKDPNWSMRHGYPPPETNPVFQYGVVVIIIVTIMVFIIIISYYYIMIFIIMISFSLLVLFLYIRTLFPKNSPLNQYKVMPP